MSAWSPPRGGSGQVPSELVYQQITAPVNVTGANQNTPTTVITSSAKVFTGGVVLVEFFSPLITTDGSAAGDTFSIGLFDGTANTAGIVGYLAQIVTPVAHTLQVPVCAKVRLTPSAASHTYIVACWSTNTVGTPSVGAGAGGSGNQFPAYLRITSFV